MGRRSRKRGSDPDLPDDSSRAERDAARERRAEALRRGESVSSAPPRRRPPGRRATKERPAAPWGSFPLAEVTVALSLVLVVSSFFVGPTRGFVMLMAGLVLGSLVGVELGLREHLAGYRSHTTVLAGSAAVALMAAVVYSTGFGTLPVWVVLTVGGCVFAGMFVLMRQLFRRRSGGLSFR